MYNNYPQFNPYAANQYYNNKFQEYNSLQFVNGRESAENFIMPPNSKTILMDQNIPRFYLKETDATGMAKITAYDFQEVKQEDKTENQYITRKEFEEWKENYESAISTNKQQQQKPIATEF